MQIFTAVILEACYEQSLIFLGIFINQQRTGTWTGQAEHLRMGLRRSLSQILATSLRSPGALSYRAHASLTTSGKMQKMY